ncbi:Strongly-conserved Zn-finger binding protein (TFIIIA) [Haplosporangium gracile]|nr:Strongly-conserved Zn-finger binding protein (TFIIIA) [Haplosporangium gracile]
MVTAYKPSFDIPLEALGPLVESIEDFTDKFASLPQPPYIVPSQQETAAANPRHKPFNCQLSHWTPLGDYIAILEYSFTCTGQKALVWNCRSHMVEFGSHYEIPELNHLGRKKRIAVVSHRYTVELPNPRLPYLLFCKKLDLLATMPTATTAPYISPTPAEALLASPIPTPANAFPENVKRIICAKVVFNNLGKSYGEIDGLCVLEYALVPPPAVESPTPSPPFSFPTTSSSSSSSSPQSPPPTHASLKWKATSFGYLLNVSSADQGYSSSPACIAGRPTLQHTLTLKLGIDENNNPAQSFFALRHPRIDHEDPSAFSMNSVEQPTECTFRGLEVQERVLSNRHKLIFHGAKYLRFAQKSVCVKSAESLPGQVLRPILASTSPPTSITPNIIIAVRNRDSGSNSPVASVSSSTSSVSGSPSSASSSESASSFRASASANISISRRPLSPGRCRPGRRGSPSSSSSTPGKPPTASSAPRICCTRLKCPKCEDYVASIKNLNAHIKYKHDKLRKYECEYSGCGRSYPRKGNLTRHIKSVHKKDELKKCEKCGEALSREYNTTKHEKTCTGIVGSRNKLKQKLGE